MTTSCDLVKNTLECKSPERVPRQLWTLPWAHIYLPDGVKAVEQDFPADIVSIDGYLREKTQTIGEAYEIGEYTDAWGATFVNVQRGIVGEVKEPLIRGDDWEDADKVHIPYELLTIDKDCINEQCAASSKFKIAGECPRPFEQLQFLRGSENLYLDLAYKPSGMFTFIERMHDFYCHWVEAWAQTDVDGIEFMDDWGSQRSLLINPELWVDIFKPMYRDYINIARKYGKKTFMHSDGNTKQIIPHLIDLGLDAFNTQIFCIGINNLEQFKGKITFWGEIDRQYLLAKASIEEVRTAVVEVFQSLWAEGGCIAQCEFGIGSRTENVRAVFESWNEVLRQNCLT
jgi:uroporphyrinogen decarboxylase